MRKTILKRVVATSMAAFTLMNTTTVTFADPRDAGAMTKNDAIYISSSNKQWYYPHNEGGYTVSVPYNDEDLAESGESVADQMFDYLFGIYKQGTGSNYESAGFKYNGLGTINGVNTKYYTKTVAFEPYNRSFESRAATSNIGRSDFNVEFRYAGVLMNLNNPGSSNYVVTNPGFPSDDLKELSTGQPVYQYAADGKTVTRTYYTDLNKKYENERVAYQDMYKLGTWAGTSGVPSNTPTIYNNDDRVMRATFQKWADTTDIGRDDFNIEYRYTVVL